MIIKTYAVIKNAGRLTLDLVNAGLTHGPSGRFFGVSVSSEGTGTTLVFLPDDSTGPEQALVDTTVAASVNSPLPTFDSIIPQVIVFFATGFFRTSTAIDVQEANLSYDLQAVVVRREIAGTGGDTEIDVLVNGVSMFVPANRPKINFSAGNNARVVVVPDTPSIPVGARLEMIIVSAEDGDPQDLVVELMP